MEMILVASLERWRALVSEIVQRRYRFADIEDSFLDIMCDLNDLRRHGEIEVGIYRQKGNYWRDMIVALIESLCGIRMRERRIQGWTDVHAVDFSYVETISGKEIPIIAGEAKMLGSPAHIRPTGERYGERPTSIDLDKRLKEVKYTPIDLKMKFGRFVASWEEWIEQSFPKFFSFWACRVGERNHIDLLINKFQGLRKYNNGVGVFLYEEKNGSYQKIVDERLEPFLIDSIIASVQKAILFFKAKRKT
jgi:hypothetical protein